MKTPPMEAMLFHGEGQMDLTKLTGAYQTF